MPVFISLMPGAIAVIGTIASLIAIWRHFAITTMRIRPSLLYPAFAPFLLRYKSFENDLRLGLLLLREQPVVLYRNELFIQFEIRANRKGERPLHIEGIEIIDAKRKQAISRITLPANKRQVIEGHRNATWTFEFETVWKHLGHYYKPENFPDLRVRLMKSSGGNALVLRGNRIKAKQLRTILRARIDLIDVLPVRPE
jgi:hypothetical protein